MSLFQIKEFAFTLNRRDVQSEEEFKGLQPTLTDSLSKLGAKFVYQLERGSEAGRLHYQGYFCLPKKIRLGTLVQQMQDDLHGIHLSASSTVGRQALKNYCMKSDTREAGPWSDRGQLPPTCLDDVIVKPFDGAKKYRSLEDEKSRRPFQETLRAMTRLEPDDRSIIWVADLKGNSGKTLWARWMCWKYGCAFHTYGSSKDVINLICKESARRTYIFNLPRSRPKESFMCDLFNCLEQIKDGSLINTKYETTRLEMESPHVIVLCNFLPSDEEKKHLSMDRWKFYRINHVNWELQSVPINENVE